MPSLPPAICSTTKMVESLPVANWVAESAAWLCSAARGSARNAGTVHESALPSTVDRKNWRRFWSVISLFIDTSCYLVFRRGHHQPDGFGDVGVRHFGFGIEKFLQGRLLVGLQIGLKKPVLKRRHNGILVRAFLRRQNFFHIHRAHAEALKSLFIPSATLPACFFCEVRCV